MPLGLNAKIAIGIVVGITLSAAIVVTSVIVARNSTNSTTTTITTTPTITPTPSVVTINGRQEFKNQTNMPSSLTVNLTRTYAQPPAIVDVVCQDLNNAELSVNCVPGVVGLSSFPLTVSEALKSSAISVSVSSTTNVLANASNIGSNLAVGTMIDSTGQYLIAVGCYNSNTSDYQFVRSTDSTLTAWTSPITIKSFGESNDVLQSSYAFIEGRAVFVVRAGFALYFMRANNADATSFSSFSAISSISLSGGLPDPNLIFAFNTNFLVFIENSSAQTTIRACLGNNLTGSFGSPFDIVTGETNVRIIGCTIVDGLPAVAYFSGSNTINYIRATNTSDATQWSTPVPVATDSVGSALNAHRALQVIRGYPAIVYPSVNAIHYKRATDTLGTDWSGPTGIRTTTVNPSSLCLTSVEDLPSVSFVESNEIRFAMAQDIAGSTWSDVQEYTGLVGQNATNNQYIVPVQGSKQVVIVNQYVSAGNDACVANTLDLNFTFDLASTWKEIA